MNNLQVVYKKPGESSFYAVVPRKGEESKTMISDRLSLSTQFYDEIIIAERSESSRSAKEEIGFSARPGLLEKIKNLIPQGIFENGSFLDLGAGYGAVVGYFAAVNPSPLKVIGVELLHDRVVKAVELLEDLQKKFTLNLFPLVRWSIIEGDLHGEVSGTTWFDIFSDVTVVFSNNAVFDVKTNQVIIDRLFDTMNDATDTRVIYVFTTSPLVNVRKFPRNSWQRFKSPERFRFLDPKREATFEDFIEEVYISPITGPGMVSWSGDPKDLSLYGIRLTNEDIITDGAFFESFITCDTFLGKRMSEIKDKSMVTRCKVAWNYGITVIENEEMKSQLSNLLDRVLFEENPSQFAKDIMDIFEENLSEFNGRKFLGDWKAYLDKKVSNPIVAGLLGERLDILVSASFRVVVDEEDEKDDYPVIETDEEKTLTPEIRDAIRHYFDPETPLPPGFEIRDDPKMGKGIFAKMYIKDEFFSRMGGEVIFETSEKIDKVVSEGGAEYLAEYRGRFVAGDIERTVWVDSKNHWSGLFNHAWDSPIPLEGHPCPKSFANASVNEFGIINFLRNIAVGEQILWDYGTEYWLNNKKLPLWDITDMQEDCLENPIMREVVGGYLDISEYRPLKSFLFELQAELKEKPPEEDVSELTSQRIHRILTKELLSGPISQGDKEILDTLNSILIDAHKPLLSRVTDNQFAKIVQEVLAARERGEIRGGTISSTKLRKIIDKLIAAERSLKKKKKEIFPSSIEKEIKSYERLVMSEIGFMPETNVAEGILSGKEEEKALDEDDIDSLNELVKNTRRLEVLHTWYENFIKNLSSVSGFEALAAGMKKWFEGKIPEGAIAARNDFFVLLDMGIEFIKVLDYLRSQIYETNDERNERKTLTDAQKETSHFLWSAFAQTGIDKFNNAYWKPTSDAAVIRAGDKLMIFLQELSNDLKSAVEFSTGQVVAKEPIVVAEDKAWAFGGAKIIMVKTPSKKSRAKRKFLVSAKTREKRLLAERGEKMLDLVRSTFQCPKTRIEKNLSSAMILNLAAVLENKGVDSLYDFDVQCSLLVYALASRYGISSRIGCETADLYKYHDKVGDFLVEHELLEIRPDAEIMGKEPNFEGIDYLFIHKIQKGKSERVKEVLKSVPKEMIIISLDDRKTFENEGIDLGERTVNRERPPGMNVYFHRPSPRPKILEPEKSKDSPKKHTLIDLTGEFPEIIEFSKGKVELTSESITIFSQKMIEKKTQGREERKMSTGISFGKPAKEKKEEEPAKASGAVTYANSFNYANNKEEKRDEYDSQEEEEENIRAEAKMDDDLLEDEKRIRNAIAAVRFPSGKGHAKGDENEDESEEEEKGETNASIKIFGFQKNPFDYLKDAEKKYNKAKIGAGKAKIQDIIKDVQKLKKRAKKKVKKDKWDQQKIDNLMGEFDSLIKNLETMLSQAIKASGALPSSVSKKFDNTLDLHIHEMQIQPGQSTEKLENIPHDVVMQVASGEANVNLEYIDSDGNEVKTTKIQKGRQNLLIPRGATYSIDAPKGIKPVITFIIPGKYDD